ncbi:MAG: hypothetical protein P9M12_04840 [Candidatus Aceula lacicola]|nr:hypothetical protein [Candidatus Aceula lacicola]
MSRKFIQKPYCNLLSWFVIFAFLVNMIMPSAAFAQSLSFLPVPGEMVTLTPSFAPVLLRGVRVNPENPFELDFIVDVGDTSLSDADFEKESEKLIKYFLASLTIPENDLWVNLSPYEEDRIIPDAFSQTEMGRDLLAQDYILKQITASLIYPEDELGKRFWDRIYKQAFEKYGTTQIPVNTFNKVWIVPEKAVVYENGPRAFVVKSHLKVMLEEDYLSLENNLDNQKIGTKINSAQETKEVNNISSQIVREIVLPQIEKEVNSGKNFASLRQIYNSLILATWFKNTLKSSILNQKYSNQAKISGVDVEDKEIREKIYNQYLDAFKKGVCDFVKVEYDQYEKRNVPRKYFSGGMSFLGNTQKAIVPTNDIRQATGSASPVKLRHVSSTLKNSSLLIGRANKISEELNEKMALYVRDVLKIYENTRSEIEAARDKGWIFSRDKLEYVLLSFDNTKEEIGKVYNLVNESKKNGKKLLLEFGGGDAEAVRAIAELNQKKDIVSITTDQYAIDKERAPRLYLDNAEEFEKRRLPAQTQGLENLVVARAEADILLYLPDNSLDYILLVNPNSIAVESLVAVIKNFDVMKKFKKGAKIIIKTSSREGKYIPALMEEFDIKKTILSDEDSYDFLGTNLHGTHFEWGKIGKTVYELTKKQTASPLSSIDKTFFNNFYQGINKYLQTIQSAIWSTVFLGKDQKMKIFGIGPMTSIFLKEFFVDSEKKNIEIFVDDPLAGADVVFNRTRFAGRFLDEENNPIGADKVISVINCINPEEEVASYLNQFISAYSNVNAGGNLFAVFSFLKDEAAQEKIQIIKGLFGEMIRLGMDLNLLEHEIVAEGQESAIAILVRVKKKQEQEIKIRDVSGDLEVDVIDGVSPILTGKILDEMYSVIPLAGLNPVLRARIFSIEGIDFNPRYHRILGVKALVNRETGETVFFSRDQNGNIINHMDVASQYFGGVSGDIIGYQLQFVFDKRTGEKIFIGFQIDSKLSAMRDLYNPEKGGKAITEDQIIDTNQVLLDKVYIPHHFSADQGLVHQDFLPSISGIGVINNNDGKGNTYAMKTLKAFGPSLEIQSTVFLNKNNCSLFEKLFREYVLFYTENLKLNIELNSGKDIEENGSGDEYVFQKGEFNKFGAMMGYLIIKSFFSDTQKRRTGFNLFLKDLRDFAKIQEQIKLESSPNLIVERDKLILEIAKVVKEEFSKDRLVDLMATISDMGLFISDLGFVSDLNISKLMRKDIIHDLRNPIGSMFAFLNLLAGEIEENGDEKLSTDILLLVANLIIKGRKSYHDISNQKLFNVFFVDDLGEQREGMVLDSRANRKEVREILSSIFNKLTFEEKFETTWPRILAENEYLFVVRNPFGEYSENGDVLFAVHYEVDVAFADDAGAVSYLIDDQTKGEKVNVVHIQDFFVDLSQQQSHSWKMAFALFLEHFDKVFDGQEFSIILEPKSEEEANYAKAIFYAQEVLGLKPNQRTMTVNFENQKRFLKQWSSKITTVREIASRVNLSKIVADDGLVFTGKPNEEKKVVIINKGVNLIHFRYNGTPYIYDTKMEQMQLLDPSDFRVVSGKERGEIKLKLDEALASKGGIISSALIIDGFMEFRGQKVYVQEVGYLDENSNDEEREQALEKRKKARDEWVATRKREAEGKKEADKNVDQVEDFYWDKPVDNLNDYRMVVVRLEGKDGEIVAMQTFRKIKSPVTSDGKISFKKDATTMELVYHLDAIEVAEFHKKKGFSNLLLARLIEVAKQDSSEKPIFFAEAGDQAAEDALGGQGFETIPIEEERLPPVEKDGEGENQVYRWLYLSSEKADDILDEVEGQMEKQLEISFEDSKEELGGIDLGADTMDMDIQSKGDGFEFNLNNANFRNIQINGLYPVIINVTPVVNLPAFLGAVEEDDQNLQLSYAH